MSPSSRDCPAQFGDRRVHVHLREYRGGDEPLGIDAAKVVGPIVERAAQREGQIEAVDAEEKQPGGRVHDHRVDPFFIHVGQAHVRVVSALAHFGATLERLLRTEQIR